MPGILAPPKLAVAFNCVALSAVPTLTGAGVFQVMLGVALLTVIVFVLVPDRTWPGLVGVNVTESECVPAASTVPAVGVYVNVPG